MNISALLEKEHCAYAVMPHPTTYTAQEMAHELHVPGREVAKTVLLRAGDDDEFIVAVVPAHKRVNLQWASQLLGGIDVALAHESDIEEHCPDCERGVLPPFGSRYGMKTIVDQSLAETEAIVFEGNTHDQAIQMRFDQFRRLEEPMVARIAL